MRKSNIKQLTDWIQAADLKSLQSALDADPKPARSPQLAVEAARAGWTAGLKLLRKHGADVNAEWRNYRPLSALLQERPHSTSTDNLSKRLVCLKWLLTHGADPEQLGGWPPTRAIITAAFVGQPEFVDELKQAGARVDGFVASALGDLNRVQKTLATDSSFATARDSAGMTALQYAAGSRLGKSSKKVGDSLFAIAKLLIGAGSDVRAILRSWGHDVDVVYFAASSWQGRIFELLLQHRADASKALVPVIWQSNFELAELAMKFGAKLDEAMDEGKPLLNQLIRWGQFKQAFWMLEQGASPDLADEQGWTALHQAASRGNEKMMKAVLEAGARIDARDRDGATALDIARSRNRPKLVALLW